MKNLFYKKSVLLTLLAVQSMSASAASVSADEPVSKGASPVAGVATPSKVNKASVGEDYDGDDVTLDTVDISAVQLSRGASLKVQDMHTTVITREQIKERPEIYLDQLLNKELGIWTSNVPQNQQDPTGAVIGMRGFGQSNGEKVLVMVDGVPMNDGMFKTIDWNLVPRDTIEKIEIVRGGGAGAMWGNLAEGGVINIITRAPAKTENNVAVRYGSFNTKVGESQATLYNGDLWQSSVHLNTIYSDGYNLTPTVGQESLSGVNLRSGATNQTANSKTNNILINNYWTPDEDTKFFLKINAHELLQSGITYNTAGNQWYKGDARGGGQWNYSKTGSANFNFFYDFSQMNKQNGASIGASATNGAASGYCYTWAASTTAGSCSNITNANTTNASQVGYNSQIEQIAYQTGGGSFFVSDEYDIGNGWGSLKDIKVGVDIHGTTLNDANKVYNYNTVSSSYTAAAAISGASVGTHQIGNFYTNAQNMFEGVFGQMTWNADGIPFKSTLGLRGDFWQKAAGYSQITGYNNTYGKYGQVSSATTTNPFATSKWAQFNPRWGFTYDPLDEFGIKGAVYRNFSAPGMNQLYRGFASSNSYSAPNAGLSPEQNFGQEITAVWRPSNESEVQATFFHNQVTNYIASTSICGSSLGYSTSSTGGRPSAAATNCNAALQGIGYGSLASGTYTSASQNLNVGNATMFGWEGSINYSPMESLKLNFGITMLNTYLTGFSPQLQALNNASVANGKNQLQYLNKQLPYVQPWTLTHAGDWNLSDILLDGLTFNYVIKAWPSYYSSTIQQQYGTNGVGTGQGNSGNVSSQVTGALTGDIAFNYKAFKQVDFNLSVQNIGDRYYIMSPGSQSSSMPTLAMPFNVMGGVRINW